jgi:hypothetical protein
VSDHHVLRSRRSRRQRAARLLTPGIVWIYCPRRAADSHDLPTPAPIPPSRHATSFARNRADLLPQEGSELARSGVSPQAGLEFRCRPWGPGAFCPGGPVLKGFVRGLIVSVVAVPIVLLAGPASATVLPAVTGISPTSGPTTGNTTVTVTGTGFTGATAVAFGSLAAKSFTVVSDTSLTAVSPAHSASTHAIVVTTPSGTSKAVAAADFTYVVGPAVTSISPTSGPTTGNTTVTVNGSGFTGATAVKFGSLAAKSFVVVSDTKVTAVSPPHGASVHAIVITTPSGSSAAVSASNFSYVVATTVTAISPSSGPTTGNTTVTITGSGFTGATAVSFGSVAEFFFDLVSY